MIIVKLDNEDVLEEMPPFIFGLYSAQIKQVMRSKKGENSAEPNQNDAIRSVFESKISTAQKDCRFIEKEGCVF